MSVRSLKEELKKLGYDLKKFKITEKSSSCTVAIKDGTINIKTIKDISMRHNQNLSMMVRFDYKMLEEESKKYIPEAERLINLYWNTPLGSVSILKLHDAYTLVWESYKKDGKMLVLYCSDEVVFSQYFGGVAGLAEALFLVKNQFTF